MNLTKLNRRIVRETDVLIDGVPVIVSLEPGGQIGIKIKGTRHTMFMPISILFDYMKQRQKGTVGATAKPHKVAPAAIPSALEAAIQLIKESDEPIHIKTLEKLVSGEIAPQNLKRMLKVLQNEHIVEHVKPFHIQAVKDPHLSAV